MECTGKNGVIVGTPQYFEKINTALEIPFLIDKKGYNYYEDLKTLGSGANDVITELYDDLKENLVWIKFLNASDRQNLIDFISAIKQFGFQADVDIKKAWDCIHYLDLSSRDTRLKSWLSLSKIQEYAKKLEDTTILSAKEKISVLEDAKTGTLRYILAFDEIKITFVNSITNNCTTKVIEDVLDYYKYSKQYTTPTGKCGKLIGSKDYSKLQIM